MPKVSVVMAVYNGAAHLKEAVESILHQTFSDFEFLIVDNKSTDRSVEIVRSFQDSRVQLIQNEKNLGQTKALNIGLKASRGEYIVRMDADDVALPTRIARQVEFLDQHPELAAVGSFSHQIDEEGRVSRLIDSPTDPLVIKAFCAASGDLTKWCLYHPTMCLRKTLFDRIGFYHEPSGDQSGYPQDYELWARIFTQGYLIGMVAEPLIKYRVLKSSESRAVPQKLVDHRLEITRRKIQFLFPSWDELKVASLSKMLEFLPQEKLIDPEELFHLFDEYFARYMKQDQFSSEVRQLREQLKLYYLSRLWATHSAWAFKKVFQMMFSHPSHVVDLRFYSKFSK